MFLFRGWDVIGLGKRVIVKDVVVYAAAAAAAAAAVAVG